MTVIVALPAEDERVYKISSEKVPHLTLLYLGDYDFGDAETTVVDFVEHVANTSAYRFDLDVDRRGELGDNQADVLFFGKRNIKMLTEFRSHLLKNDEIAKAYNSVEQFPEWTPHLTLGYPATPARKDDSDYGISWVQFDRIAVWTEDFDGPEFLLKNRYEYDYDTEMDVAMSSLGAEKTEEILKHYGVKGMKWGRRKRDSSPQPIDYKQTPGKKVKTKGGENLPASEDAINAAISRQKARKSTTDALSNQELQQLVNRMNLEQQYARLASPQKTSGQKFAEAFLGDLAKRKVSKSLDEMAEEDPKHQAIADAFRKTSGLGKREKPKEEAKKK